MKTLDGCSVIGKDAPVGAKGLEANQMSAQNAADADTGKAAI